MKETSGNEVQLQLEREVLGSFLFVAPSQPGRILEAMEQIEPRDFTLEAHQVLYAVIVELFVRHNTLDTVMLTTELQRRGVLEKAGGVVYLTELSGTSSVAGNEYRYAALRERSRIRQATAVCSRTVERFRKGEFDTWTEPVESLQASLYELQYQRKSTAVDIVAVADEIISRAKNLGASGVTGFSWGLSKLDYLTSGIERGKTYVVGATKKSGKSKFVINTLYHLHRQEVKALFLSLEMDGEGVVRELLSRFAYLDNNILKRRLDEVSEYRLREAIRSVGDGRLYLDTESFLSVNQVRLKIRTAAQLGIKVVFLDYLQRMNFQLREKRELNFATVVGHTVTQLADIAKESGVALVFLSQLAARAEGEQADISHLKDSGGIAEGVDGILILNNQDRVKKNYINRMNEVWISVEQRSGSSGLVKCSVDLAKAMYEEKVGGGPVGALPPASDGDDVFSRGEDGEPAF